MRRLLASLVATVLGFLTILLCAPPASATSPLALVTAEFRKISTWETGYQGTYTIKNHSRTALDSWTVEFSLPVNTTVTTHWDAQLTRDGSRYTFRNVGYNGSLAPGASTTFGWVAQGSGVPGECVVNRGGPCEEDTDFRPPTAPTGLHITGIEHEALTLNWTASIDDRGPVTDYQIFVDGVRHSVVAGGFTSHRVTGLRPNTPYMFHMIARDRAGNLSAMSHPVMGTTGDPGPPRTLPTAPYVDMGAWPTPTLSTLASDSGLKHFSLGAITSPTCKAMWFNHYDPRAGWAKDNIDALRAAGGEVKVTFGGAGGRELAQNCASADALFTEYDAVVRQYGLRYVDFDIEGPAADDPVSIARRSAALARLQQAHPGLRISLTLPVTPSGLTHTGLSAVTSARDAGVALDVVNVMTMDYFLAIDYGDAAVRAAEATVSQLKPLYPNRTDAQLWGMVGVTPMIGENDDHQIYDQADARQLVAFARSRNLGMIAFWDVTRDRNACTGNLSLCTNVPQTPYEFSRIVGAYEG